MATKYARAGGGNWSTDATWSLSSGGAADTVAPTAADDVILDGASGNVTIDAGANRFCRSLDCTSGVGNYTGILTHNALTDLYTGDTTPSAGNVAVKFSAGMTYSLANTTSRIVTVANHNTDQSFTSAGKQIGALLVNIQGGTTSLVLSDSFNCAGNLTLATGVLNTNSQAITASAFSSNYSLARTLTMGSTVMTLSGTTPWFVPTVTGLTVTANTATVTLTGASAQFSSGAINWNGLSVIMSGSGTTGTSSSGAFTVANWTRTGTAVKTDGMNFNSNLTVTGTMTLTGNSLTNRLLVGSSTLGAARNVNAAAVSLTNVDFRDITAAGASIPWTGTSIGNALGNTNITFTTPTTRYGVAAGNWSSTSMWSTSSGGAPGASVPLPQDNVVLDANSAAGTYTNDMPRMGADLTCTGFTRTLTNSITTELYGNFTLGLGMTLGGTSQIGCYGRVGCYVTTVGKTVPWALVFGAGNHTLVDSLNINNYLKTTTGGILTDAGFSVTVTYFQNIGGFSCTINATGTWIITSTSTTTPWDMSLGGTLNHTGTIILSGATATDRTFAGGGKVYGTLTDQNTLGGKLTITGANTFTTINKTSTVACTLTLPSATTTTVTNFNVNGIAGQLLTLNASTPASAAILSKPTGLVSCDYLSIQDSTATGGARFFAGTHSTNVSGNTGWNFQAPTYNTSSTGIIA